MEADTAARIARGLTRIVVLASEDPFTFVHPVIRRSVYGGLSVTDLEAAHARAADLLRDSRAAPEAIAAHVSASAPAGSDAVAAALRSAAGEAMSRAAPDAAIVWLRRALGEGAAAPPRPVLLFELAQAEMAVRDPATIGHLQEALELAEDPELRGRIALTLAEILAHAGQWEAGLAVMARAKRELGEANPELVTDLEAFQAVAMAYDPRLVDEFERDRPRLTGLSAEDGWAAHALASLLAAAAAVRCEGSAKVLGLVDRALAGGRLLGERGGGAWASAQILLALVAADEYERVLEVADEVAAQGRSTGSRLALLTGVGYRGQVYCRRGDLAAAEAVLRTALDLTAQTGMALWVVNAFHAFGDAILERPQLADVAEKVDALALDPVFRTTAGGAMLLEIRGRLALARRDRERGLNDLRACAETAGALRLGPTYSPWRADLALALPDGEDERAAELIAEELSLARASSLSRPLGVTLRYAGIHAGGSAGIELLRESEAKLATSPARLEHARSLVELGAPQRRGEAREQLTAGMELAHRCGAERLVGRADEELHAAGGRPRRIAQSGAEALTPSELRVALLATDGQANVEIAQELFVSLKTVETHRSSAYAKLGLSGRGARGRLTEQLAATQG
jgi:DNA-binding CsgD family transcriptional regulator/tetratricopeptide (TPR) repeat protein